MGTVEQLTGHLKEILTEENEPRSTGTLPETAPAPIMPRKTFKHLGTKTKQAEEFAEEIIELTPEELQGRAKRARERLEAAGEIDTLEDQQPDSAPP
mmetsp:Transcript_43316/g.92222  ORF Transcript_43316/g.92222 Transcript_43316/m.92222 type:complete len:97 (+) Transcript_43316:375-665(+)